jgi:putative transposase
MWTLNKRGGDEIMLKRFRYRAYPTGGQKQALARLFGCCRVVFNDVLAVRETAHQNGLPYPSSIDLQKTLITQAKHTPERAWLSEVSVTPLQQSVQDADRAYRNFFTSVTGKRRGRTVGHPRFKRKQGPQSARFTRNSFSIIHTPGCTWGFVTLSKIGCVKLA